MTDNNVHHMYEKLMQTTGTALRFAMISLCDACTSLKLCVDGEHFTEESKDGMKKALCDQKAVLDKAFIDVNAKRLFELLDKHDEQTVTVHDIAKSGNVVGTLLAGEVFGKPAYQIKAVEGGEVIVFPAHVCDMQEDDDGMLHILAEKFAIDPMEIMAQAFGFDL